MAARKTEKHFLKHALSGSFFSFLIVIAMLKLLLLMSSNKKIEKKKKNENVENFRQWKLLYISVAKFNKDYRIGFNLWAILMDGRRLD